MGGGEFGQLRKQKSKCFFLLDSAHTTENGIPFCIWTACSFPEDDGGVDRCRQRAVGDHVQLCSCTGRNSVLDFVGSIEHSWLWYVVSCITVSARVRAAISTHAIFLRAGTGLHTFLLFLGPHIVRVVHTAIECDSTLFSTDIVTFWAWTPGYAPDAFQCMSVLCLAAMLCRTAVHHYFFFFPAGLMTQRLRFGQC